MKSDFVIALTQLAAERNLPKEIVISAIEAALASAYRKDTIASGQNISVKLDPGSGDVTVHILKTVVDEVSDPETEILLGDARQISRAANLGRCHIHQQHPPQRGPHRRPDRQTGRDAAPPRSRARLGI